MQLAARPTLRRLVVLDGMIRAGGFPNTRAMSMRLEVHRRTVARDLEFLRDSLGAPLEFSKRQNGYFYRDRDFALPLVNLSEAELVALFLAERLMEQYRGTPLAADLATAFRKLLTQLPDEVTIDVNHLDDSISFRGPACNAGDLARFRQLLRAVRAQRQLDLVYWSASRDAVTRRLVDPYHLTSMQGEWYLVAYCHLREEVRMFAPPRIRSARETGAFFERPADFRIADYLDGSFRTMRGNGKPWRVHLHFTGEAARYVQLREWHSTQQLKQRPDGSVELTLSVTHLLEVRRWVMGYGAECEVLEPAELREQIRLELRKSTELYG
jgi:predicted DNA-binding transcriptional regulator YafY